MLAKVIELVTVASQLFVLLGQDTRQVLDEKPLSPCSVFGQPFPLIHGVVALRGTVGLGVYELRGAQCRELFEIQGEKWPRAVWLIATESEESTSGWRKAGDLSFQEFTRRYWEVFKRRQINAVFLGKLQYRDRYEGKRNKNGGGFVGNGFGVFGIFPVELEVYAVTRIEVLDREGTQPRK